MRNRIGFVLVLLVLLLSAVACSRPGRATTREPGGATPTQQAGAETATTQPGGVGQERTPTAAEQTPWGGPGATGAPGLDVDEDALAGLNSYRLRVTVAWTPESGEAERFAMQEEFTREPPARRLVMEGGAQAVEWVQIGDTAWFCTGGTCAQTQQGADDLLSGFGGLAFEPDGFIGGREAELVGQETVNEISTQHYRLKLSPAEVGILARGEVTDLRADVWVSVEAGLPAFVVRYLQSWREQRDDQPGSAEYSYELYDVNQPFTIEPPAGAVGMPEDIPPYPGAKDLLVMEELITFSTSDAVSTVVEFYRAELPTKGWVKTSDQEVSGSYTLIWSKEGRTLTLMIGPGQDGGTSVVIAIG